jgi:hypothetical protein
MKTQSDLTKQILNLLERNMKTKAICKILKCKPTQVYQIKFNYKKQINKAKAKAKVAAKVVPPSTTPPLVAKKPNDIVNHPPHYTDGGIEVIDFIEAKGLGYRLGNVVKYVSRAKLKGNLLEDLRKAEWYLKREIEARTNA